MCPEWLSIMLRLLRLVQREEVVHGTVRSTTEVVIVIVEHIQSFTCRTSHYRRRGAPGHLPAVI